MKFIKKSFNIPDDATEFPKTKVESVHLGEFTVSRMLFEPGWRWSRSLPEFIGTDTCQFEHPVWMIISGRFAVQMDNDEKVIEFGPGDIGMIPPGHDAWVVGDELVVGIDLQQIKANN
jgi:mannose-6-phosphate isomerase-like protein (cupin superfamily)